MYSLSFRDLIMVSSFFENYFGLLLDFFLDSPLDACVFLIKKTCNILSLSQFSDDFNISIHKNLHEREKKLCMCYLVCGVEHLSIIRLQSDSGGDEPEA